MCVVFYCRLDIAGTPSVDEDDCKDRFGHEHVCVDLDGYAGDPPYNPPGPPPEPDPGPDRRVCVRRCVPSATANPCNPEFACTPDSTRFNFKDAVCIDVACRDNHDCPVGVSNDRTCMSDADCNSGADEFCVLLHDSDDDGSLDIGACSVDGNCIMATGICGRHSLGDASASIGDPCQADVDCPVGGRCLNETVGTDDLDVAHRAPRNGYCTMLGCRFRAASGVSCPTGSACSHHFFAGGCTDLCDPADATGCRDDLDADGDPTGNGVPCDVVNGIVSACDWHGDFDCWDWGGWAFTANGLPVVGGGDAQICDYIGPVQSTCESISSGGQGCPGMAPTGNPADMDCRDPESGAPTSSNDPAGRCVDTTTSGDFCSNYGSFDINGDCMP